MPALTITAVDFTTDQLTIVGHGINTGDGFLAVYTDTGTLPAPLAPVTDYWGIRVDANTIKLATSSSNAMAGTAINLTTNGSGTLQLLSGLPYRVPGIAAVGVQIKSANDNATWQSLVALWNLLTGQAQSIWTIVKLAVGLTLAPNQHVTVSGTGEYKHGDTPLNLGATAFSLSIADAAVPRPIGGPWTFAGATVPNDLSAPLVLRAGTRIKTIKWAYNRGGAGTIVMRLLKWPYGTGAGGTVLSTTTISTLTGYTTTTTAAINYTLETDMEVCLWVTVNNVANQFGGATVTIDRP